jgi:hypothetical protein
MAEDTMDAGGISKVEQELSAYQLRIKSEEYKG